MKCPYFKSLPQLGMQDTLGGGENGKSAVCIVYPKANLEKKEYFTERMGFWKNEVSL